MQWCDVAVQFWRGPECVERVADQSHAYRRYAGGEYHGSHPVGEHHALWHVHEHGQPNGGSGYRCCTGGVDAHAVHTGNGLALDTRCADHAPGQYAFAGFQLLADVQLGWRHQGGDARPDADADSLSLGRFIPPSPPPTQPRHGFAVGVQWAAVFGEALAFVQWFAFGVAAAM